MRARPARHSPKGILHRQDRRRLLEASEEYQRGKTTDHPHPGEDVEMSIRLSGKPISRPYHCTNEVLSIRVDSGHLNGALSERRHSLRLQTIWRGYTNLQDVSPL